MPDPEKELPDLHKIFDRMFSKPAKGPTDQKQALFERTTGSLPKRLAAGSLKQAVERFSSGGKGSSLRWITRQIKQTVGVDLGASAIKVICVENGKVTAAAFEQIPADFSEPQRRVFCQERLRELKRQGLLKGRLVMGVVEEKMAVESVTMPKMPQADLEKAILWEAKERMAVKPPGHCIRQLITGETMVDGQPHKEILIFAVPAEEIVNSYGMIAGYGSRVAAAEPGILASAAALEAAGLIQPGRFIGVLDIGYKHSTLALVVEGEIRFVRTFSVAGELLTQSIVQYCKLNRDEAETQKREFGLTQVGASESQKEGEKNLTFQVGHALSLQMEQLATELDHSLRYVTYYSLGRGKGGRMECLYLVGGGSLLKNLPAFLETRLDTRVEVADPFRSVAVSDAVRAKLGSLETRVRLATALGLALRPIGK